MSCLLIEISITSFAYLSEAPHAVPHALGLSAAPHAAGASAGLSPAPQAAGASAGLSPAPHALPQEAAAFVSLFQSAKFESAIIIFLLFFSFYCGIHSVFS
jgi:hypothetical protein